MKRMVAATSADILRELARTAGGPVFFEDPQTHARYVALRQEMFDRLLPLPAPERTQTPPLDWNDEKNQRRGELIDRKYASGLSAAEQAELDALQDEMYRYRERVAPLPLRALELVREALEHRAEQRAARPT
jgi:hypothetical protein